MSKKKWYVCIEYTKDYLRKYSYQYTNNKQESIKLLSSILKQNKTIIGWVDFIWQSTLDKKIPESALHGKMFVKSESLLQDIV